MKYVALPEQLFKEIMKFLETQPYSVVKDLIPFVYQNVRDAEIVEDEEDEEEKKQ